MSENEFGYSKGFITLRGTVFLLAASSVLDEKNEAHTFVGFYKNGAWKTWEEGFSIVSATACNVRDSSAAVLVGGEGNVLSISRDGSISKELISRTDKLPNQYSGLNEVKAIGSSFYVAGMRRQVYQRKINAKKWKPIDASVLIPLDSKEVGGFLSIDGFNDSEIYCCGYSGEIWRYDGKVWENKESPTNAILGTLTCGHESNVYIGGDDGVIVVGRDDRWSAIDQDLTEDHIVGSCTFKDKVYFSTEAGQIISYDGTVLTDETIKIDIEWNHTTGFLDSNEEQLLSIGLSDILVFDGNKWERLSDPPFEI